MSAEGWAEAMAAPVTRDYSTVDQIQAEDEVRWSWVEDFICAFMDWGQAALPYLGGFCAVMAVLAAWLN